jgi:putative sterol carrier protein
MRQCLLIFVMGMFCVLGRAADAHAARVATGGSEPDAASPEEVFAQMRHSFRSDRTRGQHLRYQFNFADPQGGTWWIQIDDGAYTMGKGQIARPDVTFACTGADWVRLSNGTLGGFKAFLTGRLKVSGSQFTAHKLDDIFP